MRTPAVATLQFKAIEAQGSLGGYVDKQNVMCIEERILMTSVKESNTDTCHGMNKTWET